jgi:hypothetical protein
MDDNSITALEAHASATMPEAQSTPRQIWDALIERFETIEADPDVTEENINEAGDLVCRIMAMPAPDADAVRWKLDWLLADGKEYTDSYANSYVAQTIADYRHFLSGEARS